MSQAAGIGSLLPLVDTMKKLPDELLPDSFDRSEAEAMSSQMSAVHDLAQHLANAPVPCIFSPAGAPRYKFYADLARDGIQGCLAGPGRRGDRSRQVEPQSGERQAGDSGTTCTGDTFEPRAAPEGP